jgi:hypothetical protein
VYIWVQISFFLSFDLDHIYLDHISK